MKKRLTLSAAVAAAMVVLPFCALAGASPGDAAVEAPRVTQAVSNAARTVLARTRPQQLAGMAEQGDVADVTRMTHLQLVLKPSQKRLAALDALVAAQHDRTSPSFQQWVTPAQFGQRFGVSDNDIAAVTAWLASQGFAVNAVYPNKAQIDFSGNAGQVRQAFQTQLKHYDASGIQHIANASDIAIPTALSQVVSGVLGLNDFRPVPQHVAPKVGVMNPATHQFALRNASPVPAAVAASPMAVSFDDETRGLVPDDFAKMYGVTPLRNQGITGKGVTIALVEDGDMVPADWTNFVSQFQLGGYGGTFRQFQPQVGTLGNCLDEDVLYNYQDDDIETLLDAEWSTAMAPGAHIEVASCADYDANDKPVSDNFFGGVFVAASNLVNGDERPDILSVSYGFGEHEVDSASKAAIDLLWAQADAEGISVFVSSGDSGANASFNGGVINGIGINANAFATSPNVTAVGGTDTADVLDGTTAEFFKKKAGPNYGTATGYVPEIPWNESCGNDVAAKTEYGGFMSAQAFCKFLLKYDQLGYYVTSEGASGGPSMFNGKPAWQRLVYNAAKDQSRDIPDVSLFAGSYGNHTWAIVCTAAYPCAPGFTTPTQVEGGTSLSAPMFAGIQALIDEGLVNRGLPVKQGNVAPTLYALAQDEYGGTTGEVPDSLANCDSDNGRTGTASCVFHNVTRGSISTECDQQAPTVLTSECFFVGTIGQGSVQVGLTSTDANKYNAKTSAYAARPGWSFASGLGSVDAANLLKAWSSFVGAKAAAR